jgi:hypothetical protein
MRGYPVFRVPTKRTTNFASTTLPPWSTAPHRTEQTFKKRQSTIVRGTISRIHKVKENNASISPSVCFSAFVVIDDPVVNGLLLVVEAFIVFFTTSSLYFSCKEEQIVNVTTPITVNM